MKKVKLSLLIYFLIIGVSSCNETKKSIDEINNGLTYEEKIKKVCDCFENAGNDSMERPKCFQIQDKYSKDLGEKKTDFLQVTNKCI